MTIYNLPIFEHIQKFKENCIRLQKANKLNPNLFTGRVQAGYLVLLKDTLDILNIIKHDLLRYTIDNISVPELNDALDRYFCSGKWRFFEKQIHTPFKVGDIAECYNLLIGYRNDILAQAQGATLNEEIDQKIKTAFEV